MALEAAAVDELRQHQLLKGGHGAGKMAEALRKEGHEPPGQHHVAHAEGRRDGPGEGIQVDHVVIPGEGKERLLQFVQNGKFRFKVVLYEEMVRPRRPPQVFVPLGRRGGDARGKAPVGRDVQDGRAGRAQGGALDAVRAERQKFARRAQRAVDLFDFFVRRRFQREEALPPEQAHDQAVEVFRAGADHDLRPLRFDAPAAREIPAERVPKLFAARVGRLIEDGFTPAAHDAAHGLRQHGEGEGRGRSVPCPARMRCRTFPGGPGEPVGGMKDDEEAAPLAGLGVAFLTEQVAGVRRGDDARPRLFRERPLRREAAPPGTDAPHDVRLDLFIELQIRRSRRSAMDTVMHLV